MHADLIIVFQTKRGRRWNYTMRLNLFSLGRIWAVLRRDGSVEWVLGRSLFLTSAIGKVDFLLSVCFLICDLLTDLQFNSIRSLVLSSIAECSPSDDPELAFGCKLENLKSKSGSGLWKHGTGNRRPKRSYGESERELGR
ncbi:hypothetical protein E2542_SST31572 [Spatholobus suberectus]|nr:hypothetical protein E2542_SST31572 [Spatholobus suberectus]